MKKTKQNPNKFRQAALLEAERANEPVDGGLLGMAAAQEVSGLARGGGAFLKGTGSFIKVLIIYKGS